MNFTTAKEMALACRISEKRFRQALREAKLPWHGHRMPWTVEIGSSQYKDMQEVLQRLMGGKATPAGLWGSATPGDRGRNSSDEAYIIGLCDEFLGQTAVRQHRFDFLRGDPGRRGQGMTLPVDAWYPELMLVIEYRERQHSEEVRFFDRRHTVSGMGRGEQRKLYDQRRRNVLPSHGIMLVEFDFHQFRCTANRRLIRCDEDRQVIAAMLQKFAR